MGQAPPGDECNTEGRGTPFVKAGEFGPARPVIREWTTKPLKLATVDDVLICVVGATAGKLNRGADCAIGRSVAAIRPTEASSASFIYPRLRSEVLSLRAGSTGTAQGVISRDMLAGIAIDLPPLGEQRRIVAKLDALSARLARARAKLDLVPSLASQLRQQVLAEEFSQQRLSSWPQMALGMAVVEGLVGLVRAKEEQGSDGVPYVRMNHFDLDGRLDTAGISRVQCSPEELRRYALRAGDLLFNTRNSSELVGKVTLWPNIAAAHVYNNNILRLRFATSFHPTFVFRYMMSPAFRALMDREKSATTSVAAIYQRSLYKLPIPLPPLDEQRMVGERIEAAFARADRLEAEASRARALLDRLEASILDKAFRGELVPQDPNDEPASVLLAQVRQREHPGRIQGRRRKSGSD